MGASTIDFDAVYDDAMIEDAAKVFVRRQFRKYGWLLVLACIINIVGFALFVALGGRGGLAVAVGIIAAVGPLYFPWAYNRLHHKLAASMKRALNPTARVSISSSTFTLSAKGQSFTRQWAHLKEVIETADYFLIVVNHIAFTFVPKKSAPEDALQLMHDLSRGSSRGA